MLVWLGWGQGEDRRENHVSFLVQIHHASKVCLGEGGLGKKWGDCNREKEYKDTLWSISFPGFSHMAADGLSLEDWISESSCSQVLVLTAGVTGPLCTSWMPEINGFHCACMHELSCAGSCPMPIWNRGLGKITLHTLKINGKTQYYKVQFYLNHLYFASELLRC